ncbi:MAG: hypothetical protein ACE361_23870 [Aureliella sp.]
MPVLHAYQNAPANRISVIAMVLVFVFNFANEGLGDEPIPPNPSLKWWKGNLHTHSLWSDGDDFPEMIAEWYRTHGYHFLALSDHNTLSQGIKWMGIQEISKRGGSNALEKYRKRFGEDWVETQGEGDELRVRLKPLDEFRYLVEERGRFIMIPGEEVSDRAEGRPVHMNATNLLEKIAPVGGETVREAMANNLRLVKEQEKKLGRKIMMHLNHPNFGWAVTAEDLAAVYEERFYEVYNGHPGVNHLGDAERPSVERIWDLANTLRLTTGGPLLYGIGTDDSHDYHGQPGSHTGRGWVMVRSKYLTPEHLISALRRGDFYASSGVYLRDVQHRSEEGKLIVDVEPQGDEQFKIQFIGTVISDQAKSSTAADVAEANELQGIAIGKVLAEVDGTSGAYRFEGNELYVRAVVTSSASADDPSFEDQKKQAWTQPVLVK